MIIFKGLNCFGGRYRSDNVLTSCSMPAFIANRKELPANRCSRRQKDKKRKKEGKGRRRENKTEEDGGRFKNKRNEPRKIHLFRVDEWKSFKFQRRVSQLARLPTGNTKSRGEHEERGR